VKSINPRLNKIINPQIHEVKDVSYYTRGIIEDQDFLILSQAITLLESESEAHKELAVEILLACEAVGNQARRIGVTGSPGVGKSTFIESITKQLISDDHKAAVLTIDPSSIDNRGSILGDKTRMDLLSQDNRIFVRPSPSRSFLGGTHALTYEAMIMCEACGIDYIIVETVGVGQSEYAVSDIVDCSLLLLLPGSGDELQGIKKGITQIADIIVINKTDGDRIALAQQVAQDYKAATHITSGSAQGWTIQVCLHSSVDPEFEIEITDLIEQYFAQYDYISKRSAQRQKILDTRLRYRLSEALSRHIDANVAISKILKSNNRHPLKTVNQLLKEISIELKSVT
jgi:LAO/AO transport system kinase